MKTIPSIQKYMTAIPHTIGKDIALKKAYELMKKEGFRHLPVQDGGALVGIISDRDIKLACSFGDGNTLTVEDVMSPDPYTVKPEDSLDHVVTEMAEHKYGCAIVQQGNGKVVGIFTATDGLRVFGEVLNKNFSPQKY